MKNRIENRAQTIRKEERRDGGTIYKYELLVREGGSVADYGIQLYSVAVEMHKATGEVTSAEARDVSSDPRKAISFFELLADNLATPIDLPYVLEDELTR